MTQGKKVQKNYDQQKENYTMMKRNLTRQTMIHTERIHRKDLVVSPGELQKYCRDQHT